MKVRDMVLCAMFTALLCICAWITIPISDIALTMQTFALFLILGLLGGKRGSIVCLVYLLLGTVGLPVFSGFRGGLGALLGTTGGYISGFMLTSLAYWLLTSIKDSPHIRLIAMVLGLLLCYSCGTAWYVWGYLGGSSLSLGAVLLKCVVPYLIPDAIKLFLAWVLTKRLKRFVY